MGYRVVVGFDAIVYDAFHLFQGLAVCATLAVAQLPSSIEL